MQEVGPTKPRHAVQGHQKPTATMNDRLPVSEVHGLVRNSGRTRACLHPPATLLIQTKQQPSIQMQIHNLQRTLSASASIMVDNVVAMVVVVVVTDSGIPIVACSVTEDHPELHRILHQLRVRDVTTKCRSAQASIIITPSATVKPLRNTAAMPTCPNAQRA